MCIRDRENPVQGGIWKVTLPANSFVTLELTKGSEMTSQTLEEAKAAAEAALEALAVSNDTTADQIMACLLYTSSGGGLCHCR